MKYGQDDHIGIYFGHLGNGNGTYQGIEVDYYILNSVWHVILKVKVGHSFMYIIYNSGEISLKTSDKAADTDVTKLVLEGTRRETIMGAS